jgi:hypothetical protein
MLVEKGTLMARDISVIERAFEIAREGKCKSVSEIAKALTDEGFELAYQHLSAPSLNKQLKLIIPR